MLDPCAVSGILNSEYTELPANGGLCPCPSNHGQHASRSSFAAAAHPAQPQEDRDKALPHQQSFSTLLHGNQLPMPQPREYELSEAIT